MFARKRLFSFVALASAFLVFGAIMACKHDDDEPTRYVISYASDYGLQLNPIIREEGNILSQTDLPVLYTDDYTFNGWWDGDTQAVPGLYRVTKTVTLIAKWVKNQTGDNTNSSGTNNTGASDGTDDTHTTNGDQTNSDSSQTIPTESQDPADPTDSNTPASPTETTAAYKVEHYQQNVTDDEYTIVQDDTQTLTGTIGEQTNVEAKSYTGFTYVRAENATITADGNTVAKVYYDRNIITYTFALDGGTSATFANESTLQGRYGASVPMISAPTKNGYTFSAWNPQLPSVFGAENATFTATYAREGDYTITYELNGGTNAHENPASYNIETPATMLAAPTKSGYDFAGWYTDGAFSTQITQIGNGSTGNMTLHAKWVARTDTPYTVQYYEQTTNGSGYTFLSDESRTGTTDATTTVTASDKTGFTVRIEQTRITADGKAIVKVYYDRNTITLTFKTNGGAWSDGTTENKTKEGLYGAAVGTMPLPTKDGYTAAWSPAVPSTFTANATYTATYTARTDISYTVEHYWQNTTGNGYTKHETSTATGTMGAKTNANVKSYTGFTVASAKTENVTITADGNAVAKIYYDRKTVTLTFKANGGAWSDGTTEKTVTGRYGASVTAPDAPTKSGYNFVQWSATVETFTADATYTATWKDIPVTAISFENAEYALEILDDEPQTQTLTPTITPANATNSSITWKSDNTAVATVTNGIITPVATGTTTITATSGSAKATVTVTVKKKYTITVKSIGTDAGTTYQLEENTILTDKELKWWSGGNVETFCGYYDGDKKARADNYVVTKSAILVGKWRDGKGGIEKYFKARDLYNYKEKTQIFVFVDSFSDSFLEELGEVCRDVSKQYPTSRWTFDFSEADMETFPSIFKFAYSTLYDGAIIEKIILPNGLKGIASIAFQKCGISEITIPDTVTTIEHSAFFHCKALKTVHLPTGLTEISRDLFYGCSSLESISIPEKVTGIGMEAFGNTAISEITISENINFIGKCAFGNCSNLTTIYFEDTDNWYYSEDFYSENLQPIEASTLTASNFTEENGAYYNMWLFKKTN